jgi:hypothetical protein
MYVWAFWLIALQITTPFQLVLAANDVDNFTLCESSKRD